MTPWLLDKDTLFVLSGWFANLSAGWFGSIFVLPIFLETKSLLLFTVNLPAALLALLVAIRLAKKGGSL